MANASLALEVQDGMTVEGGAGFFSGFDAPTFDAPIGSIYLKTDATRYVKTSSGVGAGTWTQELTSTSNNGMGLRIIPAGTWTIDTNYESIITRRGYVTGRLVLNGKLSVLF